METVPQQSPQQPDVFAQASKVIEALKKVEKIETDDQEKVAATYIGVAKKVVKAVDEARLEQTRPLDERKKAIMSEYKAVTDPVDLELKRVEYLYVARQKKKTRDAAAAAAKAQREAEEKARKEAEALAAQGKQEEAAAVLQEAAQAPAPVVAVETKTRTAVGTIHLRDNWRAEVLPNQSVPARVLCKHCGGDTAVMQSGQLPAEYWTPDQDKLNQAAKNGVREIPGVRIYNDPSVSGR